MTGAEIKDTIVGVISALGGMTGLCFIVKTIYTMIQNHNNRKVTRANTKALIENKEAAVNYIKENMVTSIKVDVSAQLKPLLNDLHDQFIEEQRNAAVQLNALKDVCVTMGRMLVNSPKFTKDEKEQFNSVLDRVEAMTLPSHETPVSGYLQVTFDDKDESAYNVTTNKPDDSYNIVQV